MVPAQGVRLHENQCEQREDRERDHLLDDFQFPDRERPAELRRPDAVGRNLEAVFEQGDAPAEQYDGQYAEAFELGFECDVAVPGERHESVRQDEQGDGGDSFEHMPYGIKTAQKYQFFPYDMHVLQKNAIREFFIGMAIGYRVYGAFGHGLRQVASVCLAIGDAADPPRPDRCRAGVARNPSMTTAGRRGGGAAEIADGLSGFCARVISAKRRGR